MVDRSVTVRLRGDISDFNRAMLSASASAKAFARELDTGNDRMATLVQTGLALGPALVPLGAAAIPALSGMTNQLAFATAAAGTAILAFNGVGDALKATNEYAVEPSIANYEKMQETLSKLGPAGRDFVDVLQRLRPQLQGLQDTAQAELFPGLSDGIEAVMERAPQVERIVGEIAGALGDLSAEAGEALAGPEWDQFFDFLEAEARPTLIDMGRALGNLTEGFAHLWMAFDPLSDQFSQGFLDMSRDFAEWADNLDQTEGFAEFLDYVDRVGPKVWDTLGAMGNALVELVDAAAPVGEAVLPAIEAIADTVATIADSDLGPAIVGLAALTSAYSRLIAISRAAQGSAMASIFSATAWGGVTKAAKDLPAATRSFLDFGAALDRTGPKTAAFATTTARLGNSLAAGGKIAAGVGGLAFVMSDLDEKMGLSNTAMGAMAGSILGPWGAALGAGAGLVKDIASSTDGFWESLQRVNQALAAGPAGIEAQNAALEEAGRKLRELRDQVGEGSFLDSLNPSNAFAKLKNDVEDAFGSSDLEEAAAAYERAKAAVDESARATQDLKFEQAGLAGSMENASAAVRDQTEALIDNIAEQERTTDALIAQEDASNAWKESILTLSEELKKNGTSLSDNSAEGLANQDAIRDRVKLLRESIDADIAAGASQADLADKLRDGRKAILDSGEAAQHSRKRMRDYLDTLGLTPKNIDTWVRLHDAEARRKIRALSAAILSIPGVGAPISAFINVIERTTKAKASGGYISGPGGPTDDLIPARLSNGEYVVKASSVAKYGVGFMDSINAGRFADGGLASYEGAARSFPAGVSASGVAAAAPLPDMPIVDGSQVIGYLRDIATKQARIEVAANNFDQEQAVFT